MREISNLLQNITSKDKSFTSSSKAYPNVLTQLIKFANSLKCKLEIVKISFTLSSMADKRF